MKALQHSTHEAKKWKGKMGGQCDTPGKENHGLYQTIPGGDAGSHWPTCRDFMPEQK